MIISIIARVEVLSSKPDVRLKKKKLRIYYNDDFHLSLIMV